MSLAGGNCASPCFTVDKQTNKKKILRTFKVPNQNSYSNREGFLTGLWSVKSWETNNENNQSEMLLFLIHEDLHFNAYG